MKHKYFDTDINIHYKVIGYFSPFHVTDLMDEARKFSDETGVALSTIKCDEIYKSRRFKRMHFLYSNAENQGPANGYEQMQDVYGWLTD